MTTMTAAFQGFWKHIFDFKGRTTRKDYFLNVLWQAVWLGMIALLLALFSNNLLVHLSASVDNTGLTAVGVLFFVSVLAIAVPSLSLMVRRFNDIGLNYWGLEDDCCGTRVVAYAIRPQCNLGSLRRECSYLRSSFGWNRWLEERANYWRSN